MSLSLLFMFTLHSVFLTFTIPVQPPGVTVQSIKVQRNGTLFATLPATATSYTDTTVVGGMTYSYVVIASNSTGDSDMSNSFGIQIPVDSTPPVPQPKFQRNDTFQVVTGGGSLNIRSSPGGPIVGTIRNGSTGVILDGPQTASGVVYWKFNRGWVVETFIRQ